MPEGLERSVAMESMTEVFTEGTPKKRNKKASRFWRL
jgi:hypothetical protein